MSLPQRIAALPTRIPSDSNRLFGDAAPGHRFQIYFRNWQGSGASLFLPYKSPHVRPQGKEEQEIFSKEVANSLKEVCELPPSSKQLLEALCARQRSLTKMQGESAYTRETESTSPFATGLGNEHPIENGFAFLSPYGLPYLAGSGIKGVMRRAAEELTVENQDSEPDKWTWLDIWWLFGFDGATKFDQGTESGNSFAAQRSILAQRADMREFIQCVVGNRSEWASYLDRTGNRLTDFLVRLASDQTFRQSQHYRGALDFWDCYPKPRGDRLIVEIMTPHYGKYYQNEQSPHEAGQPVPVSFLALPAGSTFNFHVVCHFARLPEAMHPRWRQLLDAAFEHACEWVGFGAKTSVGYGALSSPGAQKLKQKPAEPEVIWEKATLKFNRQNGTLTAIGPSNAQAHAFAPFGPAILGTLPMAIQQKIKQNQYLRVIATVCDGKLLAVKVSQ